MLEYRSRQMKKSVATNPPTTVSGRYGANRANSSLFTEFTGFLTAPLAIPTLYNHTLYSSM